MKRTESLLAAIVALDSLAFALVLPLLPVILQDEGTPTWLVAVIFAAFSVCQIVAAPVLGRWGDRFGRRKVLLLSQIGTLIGFVILALSAGRPELILLSRIIDGFTAGNLAIVLAVVCDLHREEHRTAAFARINAAGAGGVVAGLAGAAWLASTSPSLLAPLAWIAAGCAAVTVLLGLVSPFPPQGPALASIGFAGAWQRLPALRTPLTGLVLTQIAMTALMAAGALLLNTAGGLSASTAMLVLLGGLVVGASVQGATGGLLERRLGNTTLLRAAWLAVAVGVLALWAVVSLRQPASPWLAAGCVVLLVIGTLIALAGTTSALSAASDLGAGATMGLSSSASAVGQLIGPAAAIAAVGLGPAVFTGFVVMVAGAGLVAGVLKRDEEPSRVSV